MSKRLQIVLQERAYQRIQRAARLRHMSAEEWVRGALQLALREEPSGDIGKKLAAIRAAVMYEFPAGDIELMLGEIESGR